MHRALCIVHRASCNVNCALHCALRVCTLSFIFQLLDDATLTTACTQRVLVIYKPLHSLPQQHACTHTHTHTPAHPPGPGPTPARTHSQTHPSTHLHTCTNHVHSPTHAPTHPRTHAGLRCQWRCGHGRCQCYATTATPPQRASRTTSLATSALLRTTKAR